MDPRRFIWVSGPANHAKSMIWREFLRSAILVYFSRIFYLFREKAFSLEGFQALPVAWWCVGTCRERNGKMLLSLREPRDAGSSCRSTTRRSAPGTSACSLRSTTSASSLCTTTVPSRARPVSLPVRARKLSKAKIFEKTFIRIAHPRRFSQIPWC